MHLIGLLIRHSFGKLTADGKQFVPTEELPKIIWASRIYLVLLSSVDIACVASASMLPALFVVLPRFYGGFSASYLISPSMQVWRKMCMIII